MLKGREVRAVLTFRRGAIGRRGRVAVLLVGVVAAAVLAGFAGSAQSAGRGTVTITYLTHWGPQQVAILKAAAARFTKANPGIAVKFEAVPFANLLTTLRTQGASSSGPAVASIYDLWLPELVKARLAAPAPSYVAQHVRAGWKKNIVGDVTKGGAIRGIPNEIDLYQMLYNKALFKGAGISSPPTNWTSLVADAKKITDKSGGVQGFGVITNWPAGVVHPWLSLVNANGGRLLIGTTPRLTDPKAVAVTTLYKKLIDAGATVSSMSAANATTTGPYLDNFAAGKTGMLIISNPFETPIKQAMGAAKFKTDVGVAPIPVGPSGKKTASVSYGWMTIVNEHVSSAAQAAGWKFLDWLNGPTSGPHGSSAMAQALLSLGILPSRTSDVATNKARLADPFLQAYIKQLPNAVPFPTVLGGEQMTDTIQKELEAVIFGQKSPEAAMSDAQKEVASILKSASS
jgi:multiple sugar transport system substrate-binding protein